MWSTQKAHDQRNTPSPSTHHPHPRRPPRPDVAPDAFLITAIAISCPRLRIARPKHDKPHLMRPPSIVTFKLPVYRVNYTKIKGKTKRNLSLAAIRTDEGNRSSPPLSLDTPSQAAKKSNKTKRNANTITRFYPCTRTRPGRVLSAGFNGLPLHIPTNTWGISRARRKFYL